MKKKKKYKLQNNVNRIKPRNIIYKKPNLYKRQKFKKNQPYTYTRENWIFDEDIKSCEHYCFRPNDRIGKKFNI